MMACLDVVTKQIYFQVSFESGCCSLIKPVKNAQAKLLVCVTAVTAVDELLQKPSVLDGCTEQTVCHMGCALGNVYTLLYTAWLVVVLGLHTNNYMRLYGSDPGWIAVSSNFGGDNGHVCRYCGAQSGLRARHDFYTGAPPPPFFLLLLLLLLSCPHHTNMYLLQSVSFAMARQTEHAHGLFDRVLLFVWWGEVAA